jgi:putative IMPACT (imprinted ancient) family translation regulator
VAGGTASDTGTCISAKATGIYASVSNKNSMTLKVQYTLSTSEAYSAAVTLTNGTASIIGNGSIDINYSFKVKFTLSDAFNTIEKVLNVGTAAFTVFFRQGGNGVAI